MTLVSCSVYSGHQSILIPPSELETNPALWLLAVSQYKVRDTFCSYSVMELCTKGLGSQTESLKVSGSAVLHALPPARWGLGALNTLLNVCWEEKIIRGHRQLPQKPRYSLTKAVFQYQSFFTDHRAIKHQEKAFIYLSFLICVAAGVDRQVLENRGADVQEAQGVLQCVLWIHWLYEVLVWFWPL